MSLQELRGRILVKGKKDVHHLNQLGKTSSFDTSSDDEASSSNKKDKKDPAKVLHIYLPCD